MNRFIKALWLPVFACLLLPVAASAQVAATQKLQQTLHTAIARAYPASVRMWGYDTVARQQMSAQFSGVVVSAQGHILTAAHTIVPGKTYQVMFPDGRAAIALGLGKIEFAENKTRPDVAMMKIITPGNWPYAQMGNSAGLQVNEPCISIAYPETLNQPRPAVRFGYVSSVKNSFGFVQSTCKMEPGDSGGPLFDSMGRVVALHSAIDVPEDVNYEIPVDLYKTYWTALQQPQVYTSLPDKVDTPKQDVKCTGVVRVPDARKLKSTLEYLGHGFDKTAVIITSHINGRPQKIYGTLFSISIDGRQGVRKSIVVSKSSMVGKVPLVKYGHNRPIMASIITRSKEHDLVLLDAGALKGQGIGLEDISGDTIQFAQLGSFLISPLPDTAALTSVAGSMLFGLPKYHSMGYLGAAVNYTNGPMLLTRVQPDSPAGAAGLAVNDQVLSINGVSMQKPEDYGGELQKYWPGDTVVFKLKRANSTYMASIVLTTRPAPVSNHPAELFAGGKSARRDGFAQVFVHDATLKPSQCGGPVYDLQGHLYGINIARFSRTACLAVPAAVIRQLLSKPPALSVQNGLNVF